MEIIQEEVKTEVEKVFDPQKLASFLTPERKAYLDIERFAALQQTGELYLKGDLDVKVVIENAKTLCDTTEEYNQYLLNLGIEA